MEFLHKLYDMEYFGITLFIIIVALVFLFLIILFFGKKDEKKKLEETKKLDLDTKAFKDDEPEKDLEIPEVAQPMVNNDNLENIFKDNKDELADKIREDMERAINNIKDIKPETVVIVPDEDTVQVPVIEDVFEEEPSKDIFTDNSNDEIVIEDIETPVEEKKTEFELPKLVDMPKLKEDEKPDAIEEVKKEENIQAEEEKKAETVSDFDKLFGDIESETYNIDK